MCDSSVATDAAHAEPRGHTAPASPSGAPPPSAAARAAMQAHEVKAKRLHVKTVKYAENEALDSEMRSALAAFDLDKDGRVSTTEVLAAAKALQEVRGQNQFLE